MLFASFPVVLLLNSSGYVAIVRIRSTTLVHLLHGLVLLPSGILGKMTVTFVEDIGLRGTRPEGPGYS